MLRRIVRHAEYQTFQKTNLFFRLPHFVVPVILTQDEYFSYGITITKKMGNSVLRNRLKRRIKAWFISQTKLLPHDIKINLIAKNGALELSWVELSAEMQLLLEKLKEIIGKRNIDENHK